MAEVRLRGSCVTPGENNARSEKRRPLSGKSAIARSSSSVETALGCVSTSVGDAETVTCSCALATLRRNSSSAMPPTSMCSWGVTWGTCPGLRRARSNLPAENSSPKPPSALLTAVKRMPVAAFTTTIEACATRLPEGSNTVPRIAPVAESWPATRIMMQRNKAKRTQRTMWVRDEDIRVNLDAIRTLKTAKRIFHTSAAREIRAEVPEGRLVSARRRLRGKGETNRYSIRARGDFSDPIYSF